MTDSGSPGSSGRHAPHGPVAAEDQGLGELPEWCLSDLYAGLDAPELAADLARAAVEATEFAARYQGTLAEMTAGADGGAQLADAIAAYEAMEDRLGRVMSYAALLYASDTVNPVYGKFYGDMQEKVTRIGTDLLFFTLELNRLEEGVLAAALKDPQLARYRPWVRDVRIMRPYQLPDEIERVLHEKSIAGRAAWNRLFDETMARLRFTVDGAELTVEAALHLLSDKDGDTRRRAAQALAETFQANIGVFTLITNTLAKDKEIEDRWRGYEDLAQARHLANRVEPEVVAALTQAVQRAYPDLSHRYYRLKARWNGCAQLDFWDRNAPLPEDAARTIPWQDAQATVLGAYDAFAPWMAAIGEDFFAKGWIDAPMRPGKSSGAFSHPTVPSAHPYILLNYQGKVHDVMTLAHELGHGVHQVLAARQGALLAETPLTLAETASVFGEMLTFRKLLAETRDPALRKAMLASKVEDMLNTVVRQIAFYTFERRAHDARRNGELTAEALGRIWLDVQAESLGPAIKLGAGYENFWCYIPHFIHSPFYVYAYAFGDCLVNSLYAVYEQTADGFADKYRTMLEAGGTLRHRELLAPFGLDASDPGFWDKGLSVIGGLIDELEIL